MHDYNLGFISNEDIYEHVKKTVEAYRREITLDQFNDNIIDPIKLTFDAKVYGKTIQQAIEDECFRQIDKSNTNRIGYFHQNLFKYAGSGWKVPKAGFDVENDELHIYVEMKNKHNTMNSASSQKTYMKMQGKLLEDDEATCYLVEVISKNSRDVAWRISLDGKPHEHKKIRRMSMDKFYSLVFGIEDAFFKLCAVLPQIIEDVVKDNPGFALKNTVYEELTKEHSDILTSLYLWGKKRSG
ncbi:MAG: Eco47II family restriction endonuclease [Bacteroides sp.]|nr:Eco47II family restriction endonuclease [Bacteroides sp.]MCM1414234.1 Eco47II family restriction endonuclease [Bacteroides sp.]MCM1472393.1 Eco47II family restriction endonuclease [Bacteroides sp.]